MNYSHFYFEGFVFEWSFFHFISWSKKIKTLYKIGTFLNLKNEYCHLLPGLILFRKIGFKKALRTVCCLSVASFKLFSLFKFNFPLKKEYSLDFFCYFFWSSKKSREVGDHKSVFSSFIKKRNPEPPSWRFGITFTQKNKM